jgi:hypothetical protein
LCAVRPSARYAQLNDPFGGVGRDLQSLSYVATALDPNKLAAVFLKEP